jgi:hypothetical protein
MQGLRLEVDGQGRGILGGREPPPARAPGCELGRVRRERFGEGRGRGVRRRGQRHDGRVRDRGGRNLSDGCFRSRRGLGRRRRGGLRRDRRRCGCCIRRGHVGRGRGRRRFARGRGPCRGRFGRRLDRGKRSGRRFLSRRCGGRLRSRRRCGLGLGDGHGLGQRSPRERRRRRDGCRRAHRQEPLRIDVAVRVGGRADAEMHVGNGELRRAAWPDRPDVVALRQARARLHRQRAEMREGHGVPVGGPHAHRVAVPGCRACEGDDAAGRRAHRVAGRRTDVDAPMLPAGVRVRRVEPERLQHRAVDRPGPSQRARGCDEDEEDEPKDDAAEESAHGSPPLLSEWQTERAR